MTIIANKDHCNGQLLADYPPTLQFQGGIRRTRKMPDYKLESQETTTTLESQLSDTRSRIPVAALL